MRKKVILFGGSGLLGRELHKALEDAELIVFAPTRKDVDLTDYRFLEKVLVEKKPDSVIHAAGLIDVEALEKDPLPGWKVNALSAGAIARMLSEKSQRTKYLYMSTNYVFSGKRKSYVEKDVPDPVNLYGKTKAHGEQLVASYCRDSVPYHIVRTSWIYSHGRPTFVDEVTRALRAGEVFEAAADQYGNPTHARDLAQAIVRELVIRDQRSGVYHLVNAGPGASRYEIARETAGFLGIARERVVKTSREAVFAAKRPSVVLLNTKLPPMRDWREALRGYLNAQYGQ